MAWVQNKPYAVISGYAQKNPAEDFAEAVVAYRYTGAKLKAADRWVYEYIQNEVFDGMEYDAIQSCTNAKTRSESAQIATLNQNLQPVLPNQNSLNPKLVDTLTQTCAFDILDGLFSIAQFPTSNYCVTTNLFKTVVSTALNSKLTLPTTVRIPDWKPSPEMLVAITFAVRKNFASRMFDTITSTDFYKVMMGEKSYLNCKIVSHEAVHAFTDSNFFRRSNIREYYNFTTYKDVISTISQNACERVLELPIKRDERRDPEQVKSTFEAAIAEQLP